MKALVVLVADKNTEAVMQGLLKKIPSIEHLVEFSFDILVHPYRDPGVFNGADEFLKPLIGRYDYALVLLDHQG